MRLLVTGGAGFIGSNFVHYILGKYPDHEVIDLDALTYAGSLGNLEGLMDNPRHRFVQGRIEDGKLVGELMEGVDVVINFAAESHVAEYKGAIGDLTDKGTRRGLLGFGMRYSDLLEALGVIRAGKAAFERWTMKQAEAKTGDPPKGGGGASKTPRPVWG